MTDHTNNVVLMPNSCWSTHAKPGRSFKTKTRCIHNSTVWPVSYITSSVGSLTRIRSREDPLDLFMTITGTLGRLHKVWHHKLKDFSNSQQMEFGAWCHPVDSFTPGLLNLPPPEFCHVSLKSRVTFSCQGNLQVGHPRNWPEAWSVQWQTWQCGACYCTVLLYFLSKYIFYVNSTQPPVI